MWSSFLQVLEERAAESEVKYEEVHFISSQNILKFIISQTKTHHHLQIFWTNLISYKL